MFLHNSSIGSLAINEFGERVAGPGNLADTITTLKRGGKRAILADRDKTVNLSPISRVVIPGDRQAVVSLSRTSKTTVLQEGNKTVRLTPTNKTIVLGDRSETVCPASINDTVVLQGGDRVVSVSSDSKIAKIQKRV